MEATIIISAVSVFTSISSIVLAYLGLRRNERKDRRIEGKFEGEIATGVAHIKEMLAGMESHIASLDAQCRELSERLARLEESQMHSRKGGM